MKAEFTKLVTFRLGDDLFAADIFAVERVLRYQEPTSVPEAPAWIEGVLEYQSRVVPVISLRRRFELPERAPTGETRIIVLNARGEWIGAIVDAVVEVSTIEPGQLSAPPSFFRGLAGEYLKGIVRRGDRGERLVIVLDVDRLLSATERMTLELEAVRGAAAGAAGNA
jgi:purine-binding chemotaxis protein CheW